MYAGAARCALPRGFAFKNKKHQTPRVSLIAQVIIAAFLSFLGNLDQLISYMTYAELMDRLIVQFALLYMRYNNFQFEGNLYVNPIYVPLIYVIICVVLLAIPIYQVELDLLIL
jgi:amino acid transporter